MCYNARIMKDTQKRDTILIIAVLFGVIALLYVLTLKGSVRRQQRASMIQINTENVNVITPEPEVVETASPLPVEDFSVEPMASTEPLAIDAETTSTVEGSDAIDWDVEYEDTTTATPTPVSAGITQVELGAE